MEATPEDNSANINSFELNAKPRCTELFKMMHQHGKLIVASPKIGVTDKWEGESWTMFVV